MVPEGSYRSLSEAQALSLIEIMDYPWNVFYQMMLETGVRVSEGLNVKADDIINHSLRVRTLKRKDASRLIPLMPLLEEKLKMIRPTKGYLFSYSRVAAWKALQRAAAQVGIPPQDAHPHVFRHSFAVHQIALRSMFAENDAQRLTAMAEVQYLLGHKSFNSTAIYLKPRYEDVEKNFRRVRQKR